MLELASSGSGGGAPCPRARGSAQPRRSSMLLAAGVLAAAVGVVDAAGCAAPTGARAPAAAARGARGVGAGLLCMALRGGGKKHRHRDEHSADGYREEQADAPAEKERKEIVAERVAKAAEDLKETLKTARETVQVRQACGVRVGACPLARY